ncbi:MAG TPA: hypothetical protein VK654_11485 [Nitrospirota bacterium]|nr:hypothetical protein [Nitrospirota bacterium]
MKKMLFLLVVFIILLSAGVMPAHAYWRGHIWIGPIWGPWWGYPGYPYPYYESPPVVIQQQPPVYEERAPQQEQQSYWYYCRESKAYYPYVKQCPGGWLKVVPTPAPPK